MLKAMLKPRLWPWHMVVLAIAVTFVQFGFWQLDRHGQQVAENALLLERLQAEPEGLVAAMDRYDPDAPDAASNAATHRRITSTGRFDADGGVLLRSQSYLDRPGYHAITPFQPEGSDRWVLVDRGWVPYDLEADIVTDWSPPAGTVRIEGRLMPERDTPVGPLAMFAPRDPESGPLETVARIDVDRLQPQYDVTLAPFYVQVSAIQRPTGEAASTQGLPLVREAPEPEPGPHLSYALQWFSFAIIGVVGYVLLLRARLKPTPSSA
jgi:surfeit locus 1 family protein